MDSDLRSRERDALLSGLDRWVSAGLVSADQASAIAAFEAAPQKFGTTTATSGNVSHGAARQRLVIEALTYVGGAVILAALSVVVVGYWETLGRAWQIAIPALATGALLVAGMVVRLGLGAAAVRSRGALWMVSTATFTGLLVVLTDTWGWAEPAAPRVVSVAVFCYALLLWLGHRFVTQQAALFAAALFVVVTMCLTFTTGVAVAGAAVSVLGIGWGAAARQGWLPGQGRWWPPAAAGVAGAAGAAAAERKWGTAFAAVGATIGAVMLANSESTAWSGILPVVVIVAAGIVWGSITIIVIGALAALVAFPTIADHYLHSTIAVALVLLATGAVMVAIAVTMLRGRHTEGRSDYSR